MVAGFSVCNYLCFSSHLDLFCGCMGVVLSLIFGVLCSVLSSSGVTPAVSPAWGQAGETAAAVPGGTACWMECVLITLSAQTVSQPSSPSLLLD